MSPTLHKELLYVAIPIKEDGQLKAIIRIAEPTANFLPSAQRMKQAIFLVYSLFWLILSGIILQILHRRNRPVETILPVIKKMIKHPDNPEIIMQSSPQWKELYQSVNLLSEQMSHTYQAYSASEKRLYTLLNELMIGVFIIDEDGKLLLMNATMQEQLSNFAAPLQRSFTETITDTQLIQMIYQINDKHPFTHEEIQTTNERVLDVTLRYFEEAKQILGVSFVGNVSHELKTPVTSLIGFTETLLDGAKDDPETLTAFLKIMQKDAYRLENLIQEIIQLSKSADIDYHIQTINVDQVFQQILTDYTPVIEEKQLTITLEGDTNLFFTTKMELFTPICKNLIENAINYSLPQGEIKIHFAEKSGLVLYVQDFGIGIEKEEQVRIFERFYRVDKARARNSGGTGLGLAIVKDYVEILGGSIHVDSHLGVGSTFHVFLPMN
jgi:two-component system phosphate regulon sensor histidine kinase PhoR